MLTTEEAPTISAFKGENNIFAAVLTLRRCLQLPKRFIKNWLDGMV